MPLHFVSLYLVSAIKEDQRRTNGEMKRKRYRISTVLCTLSEVFKKHRTLRILTKFNGKMSMEFVLIIPQQVSIIRLYSS